MSIGLIILTIISTIIIGWVVIKNKLMWMEFHIDNTIRLMEQRAHQLIEDRNQIEKYAIQLSNKVVEVEKRERGVDERAIDNIITADSVQRKTDELRDMIHHNQSILKLNEKVLKKNTTQLYHLKETSSYLHSHYESIIRLSDDILYNRLEPERAMAIRADAVHNIGLIDEYFFNNFRMTVEQYRKSIINVVGKPSKRSGEDDSLGLITDSSLN